MNMNVRVYYVGNKAKKRDTLTNSKTVWFGFGDSKVVDEKTSQTLLQYPTVFVDEKTWAEEYAQAEQDGESSEDKPSLANASATTSLPVVDPSLGGNTSEAAPSVDRTKAIQEVIRKLERNKDNFGSNGAPKIAPVRALLGEDFELQQKEMMEAFSEIKEEFRV